MSTIKKTTKKVTKEAMAKKLYNDLTIDQKNELWALLGRIACGEVRNFYSTKVYKNLSKAVDEEKRAVIEYICRKVNKLEIFDDMTDLVFTKEK